MATTAKEADLAGPGVGSYEELERILPDDYEPLLSPLDTMRALYGAKRLIEDRLCEELNLNLVQVPLIDREANGEPHRAQSVLLRTEDRRPCGCRPCRTRQRSEHHRRR